MLEELVPKISSWIMLIFTVVGFATFLNKINKPITNWLWGKGLDEDTTISISVFGAIILFFLFGIMLGSAGDYIRNY